MYNAKAVILGILVFAVLFSTPFWANFGGTKDYKRPAIVLPQNEKECVEPVEYMRAEHMYLLNEWRDQALRYENRTYVSSTGKKWTISLQNTCLKCHSNYEEFCDKCHVSNSVDPYCWTSQGEQVMNKSRRSFLKVAGLSVFALSSGLATMAGSAQAGARIGSYEPNAKALKAKRWAMVIDTRAFKSAREYAPIIEACHKAHNVPTMEGHQDIKWMWLEKFDHAFPDDLNEHLTSRVKDASYPLLCNHCTNPPCVRVCPTQATYQMEDGIIAMDYHRCIGCRFCMAGCPFGARSFNFVDPRKYLSDPVPNPAYPTRMIGVVEKCTFCAERLAVGQMPACVEAAGGRILFGDLNDPKSDVCKALASNYSIRRKPNLGTQPGVYYLI